MVENAVRLETNVESQLKTRKLGGILKSRPPAKSLDTVPEYATASHLEKRSNSFISEGNEHNQAKATAPNEEQQKFNILCQGVQSCLALFQTSMAEMLDLKDELLKHALPPTVLLKITLVSAKLFRSASDLSVPINELVRLVKLYSAPWETKSAALKKLHEDYENKQRQLNVALQKLVLVGIQSDRMAKERRVLNWERLFSRMMTSKAQGYRWKFLIESFKQKAKTGEVFAAGASTDEEEVAKQRKNAARLDAIRRRSMSQRGVANSPTKSILQGSTKGSIVTGEWKKETNKVLEEEEENLSEIDLDFKDFNLDEGENSPWPSRDLSSAKTRSGTSSEQMKSVPMKASRRETRPKTKFFGAGNDEETEGENVEGPVKSPIPVKFRFSPIKKEESLPKKPRRIQFDEKNVERSHKKQPSIRFFAASDEEEEETKTDIELSQPQAPPVVKVDQACWTEEPDYERYLHVRLFRPVCLKADLPHCTLTLGDQLFKSGVFPEPQPPVPVESPDNSADNKKKNEKSKERHIKQKAANRTGAVKKTDQSISTPSPTTSNTALPAVDPPPPQFEEFVFKLPDSTGYCPGERKPDMGQEQLKIAVHPAENTPMIALACVTYNELKIKDEFDSRWSHRNEVPSGDAQQLTLFSVISVRDMPFNSNCGHVPIVCYESKVEKPKKLAKETETVSFEELVNEEIAEKRRAEEEQKANEVPEPVYTEGDLNALRDQHVEEIQLLQREFELRISELSKGLSKPYSAGTGVERTVINAATLPIFMRSPSPTGVGQSEQGKTPRPPSEARSSPRRHRPKIANLPEWGKDLPQDFLVRLQMFAENSEKYRQKLGEKTKQAIQEKYEQQMAVHNRLDIVEGEEMLEDVCLPAVFMPTPTGHVYTPKAHSYFHPPGSSEVRLTQPPSVFKLPSISPESQVSVLNLFDMGKTFLNTGPRWSWGEEDSRPHTTDEPRVNQGFPSATMGMHHSPSFHFDRSKTR